MLEFCRAAPDEALDETYYEEPIPKKEKPAYADTASAGGVGVREL